MKKKYLFQTSNKLKMAYRFFWTIKKNEYENN